jgi:serine protease Do
MKYISKPTFGFFSALVGALIAVGAFHFTSWGKGTSPNITVETTPINRAAKLGTSFAPVVKKAAPSVVNIYSTRIVHQRLVSNPLFSDPFFRQFFGDQIPNGDRERTRREESLGSGVIISPDGYILTANHVVEGADEIKVAIDDGKKEYTAKVIGTDPPTDVAILKIDAKDLHAITLGDSDQLEVGDIVLAIGNPFGLGQSVSQGIVSGLGRHYEGIKGYQNFIQTDAAINKGNSGGALVDAEGRLIGINTWIASSSGGSEGIGFAVPINLARHIMERLISGGKVTRGFLGVTPQDIDAGLAEQFGLPDESGALVDDVLPNTPAAKGGIKSGDVITAFNDKPITDSESLMLAVSECAPGSNATVKLLRNGHDKTIAVTLGELHSNAMESQNDQNDQNNSNADNSSSRDALNGVTVEDLNPDVEQELKIPANIQGAIVTDVDQDSNYAEAGLQRGDVIVEINRQPVSDAEDAVKLRTKAKGDQILLKIWRRDGNFAGTRYLSVDNTEEK